MSAIVDHKTFKQPENDLKLWKYMDLPYFISMLKESSLYLSRLDKLDDPREGRIGKYNVSEKIKTIEKQLIREKIPEAFDGNVENEKTFWRQISNLIMEAPKTHFISCWHANENESLAMWKIYSRSDFSLAIITKYSKLKECLSEKCYMGLVEYHDYENEYIFWGNIFNLVMSKRVEYIYENEVRIVKLREMTCSDIVEGVFEKVNLNNLIEEIILSPSCPNWFIKTFIDICSKYNYSFHIKKSELYNNIQYDLFE